MVDAEAYMVAVMKVVASEYSEDEIEEILKGGDA